MWAPHVISSAGARWDKPTEAEGRRRPLVRRRLPWVPSPRRQLSSSVVEAGDGLGGESRIADGGRRQRELVHPLARSDRSRWWRPYCSWFAWTRSISDSQIAAATAGDDKLASAINALEELLHKGSPALAAYERHVIFLKRA
uniref:Uncharacterized protein n=1 Tax=Oryza rufipogon TaxID=4529 RepID=A0A0E0MY38_ORYRU